ncbi:hypothetical protein H5410_000778 [Solanum commersonii]|uniref:AP2/ERF domain-containing protein n=1 Tax=Solanum commersonii TaxID=4109 RepID=A0A9J6AWT7_SOLCO|nr:hypothetical protein H5410_000778 [Solanum commersonii]
MASKDELHENEREKKQLNGKTFCCLATCCTYYITDNDATDSSSDEEENLQGEKSKRHKRICKEIIIRNGKTNVTTKMVSSKEKKDTNLLQENVKKYKGVRQRKWGRWVAEIRDIRMNKRCWLESFDTALEVALAYDKAAIEIKDANAVTNIIEPPPKERNPIHQ